MRPSASPKPVHFNTATHTAKGFWLPHDADPDPTGHSSILHTEYIHPRSPHHHHHHHPGTHLPLLLQHLGVDELESVAGLHNGVQGCRQALDLGRAAALTCGGRGEGWVVTGRTPPYGKAPPRRAEPETAASHLPWRTPRRPPAPAACAAARRARPSGSGRERRPCCSGAPPGCGAASSGARHPPVTVQQQPENIFHSPAGKL